MAEILRHRRETRRQTDEIKPLPKLPRHLSTLPLEFLRGPDDSLLDVFLLDGGKKVGLRTAVAHFPSEPRRSFCIDGLK
jgi:hypothetical protein